MIDSNRHIEKISAGIIAVDFSGTFDLKLTDELGSKWIGGPLGCKNFHGSIEADSFDNAKTILMELAGSKLRHYQIYSKDITLAIDKSEPYKVIVKFDDKSVAELCGKQEKINPCTENPIGKAKEFIKQLPSLGNPVEAIRTIHKLIRENIKNKK